MPNTEQIKKEFHEKFGSVHNNTPMPTGIETEKRITKTKTEQIREIKRSELWNKIYYIVKQIPREKVLGDAMDASSASTEIESLLSEQRQSILEEVEGLRRDDSKEEHFDLEQTGFNHALDTVLSIIKEK